MSGGKGRRKDRGESSSSEEDTDDRAIALKRYVYDAQLIEYVPFFDMHVCQYAVN